MKILVPVLFIGMIAIAPSGFATSTMCSRAKSDMLSLEAALMQFRTEHRRYPTAQEGFQALVTKPDAADLRDWKPLLGEGMLDPWQHPYRYVAPDSDREYPEVYSLGQDGVSRSNGNDPDDLNTWSTERPEAEDLWPTPEQLLAALAPSVFIFWVISLAWRYPHRSRAAAQ